MPFLSINKKRNESSEVPDSNIIEIEYNGLKWIDIIKPTKLDIDTLGEKFNFHELILEDCLTEHQRAKIDDFDDYSFIVMHFPRYKKELFTLESTEINVFISSNYLITLHEGELKPLMSLSELCRTDENARIEYMGNGSAILLYEIIKGLFDYCFPMLDKIDILLNNIHKEIFRNTSKQMLESISRTKIQIIDYRRVIKPLRPVTLILEKAVKKYLPKGEEIYFDDITDKVEKIWDMLENHKEVIEAIDSTFSSLTDQKSNNLMRIFTIVQVVILPMTLVGGLFSMNVGGIPMHSYANAFWIVFGMILIPTTLIGLALIFKRKSWF